MEQPVGTGFSHGPLVHSEQDVSEDFYGFLINFFDTFKDTKDKSLYIVGESYAGMYVPSIAHFIHQQNKKGRDRINLAGIGLGNGWIDASTQGKTVIDYAYWHGMIDSTAKESLHEVWEHCQNREPMEAPFHDFTVPDECNVMGSVMDVAGASIFPSSDYYAPNAYDVTTCTLLFFDDGAYSLFVCVNLIQSSHNFLLAIMQGTSIHKYPIPMEHRTNFSTTRKLKRPYTWTKAKKNGKGVCQEPVEDEEER